MKALNTVLWSLSGSAMILLILLLRRLFQHRISSNTVSFLWMAAALRLMIPWSLPVFSIRVPRSITSSSGPAAAPGVLPNAAPDLFRAALYGWLIVSGVLAVLLMALYIIIYRRYRDADETDIKEVCSFLQTHPLRRKPAVRTSRKAVSPFTYGILRPVIILPEESVKKPWQSLDCILLHEYVHVKRLDALKKMLFALCLVMNWYNPLVWMMFFAAGNDLEMACDEACITGLDRDKKRAYALSLLSVEEWRSSSLFCHLRPASLEKRIRHISEMKDRKYRHCIGALLPAALLSLLFFLGPKIRAAEEKWFIPSVDRISFTEQVSGMLYKGEGEERIVIVPDNGALSGQVRIDILYETADSGIRINDISVAPVGLPEDTVSSWHTDGSRAEVVLSLGPYTIDRYEYETDKGRIRLHARD